MDLFFIIEAIIVIVILGLVIYFTVKHNKAEEKTMGSGYGTPSEYRELTQKELELYKSVRKKTWGQLYSSRCELAQNYGSDSTTLKRQVIVSALTSGNGIYGYPCKVKINETIYTLPRYDFYYMQDIRMQKGQPCRAIWEEIDGKFYFRIAIPEIYIVTP